MFDVDKFKQVNDTYGHLIGDQLLAEIGRRLEDIVRLTDIKCRYGGDEFLVLLPDTPLLGAQHVAESLRATMSAISLPIGDNEEPFAPTVSVGVAVLRPDDRDIVSVIARADRALYDSKQRGRNCVSFDRTAGAPVSFEHVAAVAVPFDRSGTGAALRLIGTA